MTKLLNFISRTAARLSSQAFNSVGPSKRDTKTKICQIRDTSCVHLTLMISPKTTPRLNIDILFF